MLKRVWDAESNGKLSHLFIPNKTATLVPEFTVEDVPLGRISALVPGFAVKDMPLGRTLMIYIYIYIYIQYMCVCVCVCACLKSLVFCLFLAGRHGFCYYDQM